MNEGTNGTTVDILLEREELLRQLEDQTNQTWFRKRKRWAALVRVQDAEIQRLRLLTFCGCGDQFTEHDQGTCGACCAGMCGSHMTPNG